MIRVLWAAAFLALVVMPLLLAAVAGEEVRPWSAGGVAIELSMTTGLLGLSTLAATVVLPSRVRSLTEAFGIGRVLRSHRWLASITVGLVLAHVVFVIVDRPANIELLNPVGAPRRARAGLAALVALLLIGYLSRTQRRRETRYEVWRWVHCLLALVVLVGAFLHVYWLDHLMRNAAVRGVVLMIMVAVGAVMINRWVRRPLASLRHAYVVEKVRPETPTASTIVLRPARERQRPLDYRPGQVAWLRLDNPLRPFGSNPFTIASGIANPRELEFTIRRVGDFTASLLDVRPGRRVYVDGPYGAFNDDHSRARSLLLVAAGVGITPMMSMLRSHAHRRDPRQHCLVISARTEEELMFREELDQLAGHLDLDVVEVVSRPDTDWFGTTGRVDHELLAEVLDAFALVDPHAFLCGPGPMVSDLRGALERLGVPAHRVHTEEFEAL